MAKKAKLIKRKSITTTNIFSIALSTVLASLIARKTSGKNASGSTDSTQTMPLGTAWPSRGGGVAEFINAV